MNVQIHKMVALKVTVALVSFFVLILEASPLAAAGEGTAESATKPAKPLTVQVQAPDGKPAPNMTVVLLHPFDSSTNATLTGTTINGGGKRLQTDAAGQFTILPEDFQSEWDNIFLVIANEKGFSFSQRDDLTNHPTMVVRPWGRVEGVRINRNRPLAGQRLRCSLHNLCIRHFWPAV